MLVKTRGIILKTVKYSETSVICKVYTESLGLRTYIVSGVRTKQAGSKAGLFKPLGLLDLVVYERAGKNVQRIKEFKPNLVYTSIPFDIIKSSLGLFIVEVLDKTLQEETENGPLFHFIYNSILFLEESEENLSNFHLYFLLELSKYLGIYPHNNYKIDSNAFFDLEAGAFVPEKGDSRWVYTNERINQIINTCLADPNQRQTTTQSQVDRAKTIIALNISREDRKAVLDCLMKYYAFHISTFSELQSIMILQEIFN